jgi:hypothetical protein
MWASNYASTFTSCKSMSTNCNSLSFSIFSTCNNSIQEFIPPNVEVKQKGAPTVNVHTDVYLGAQNFLVCSNFSQGNCKFGHNRSWKRGTCHNLEENRQVWNYIREGQHCRRNLMKVMMSYNFCWHEQITFFDPHLAVTAGFYSVHESYHLGISGSRGRFYSYN